MRMRRRFTLLALSLLMLVLAPGAQVMATSSTPGFHAAVVMPGSGGGSEPSLTISKEGTRYVSWQSPGKFAASSDGVTFTALATPDTGAPDDVTNAVSSPGPLQH